MKNVPFKRFLVNRNGGMWGSEPGSDEFDVLCIRVADFDYENLKTKASASTVRSITEKQLQKNQLHDGDILLEKSGGGEKTPVGRAVYYSGNDDAICSNFIERLTVNQQTLNPKFACYILSAAYSQRKNFDCIKQTTGIQNLSVDDYLSSVTVPLFDIETQKRITKWLDKQLSKVAQVITAKQAQLQKLSSYRQFLITRAVTKGLDPNVEIKDSGVEWIGKIPSKWVVTKTLNILSIPITDGPHETPKFFPEGIPFISAEAVSCGDGVIDFDHLRGFISEEYYEECSKKYVPKIDDIYMIKSGATTGKVAIVNTDKKFTIWSPLAVFRANRQLMLPMFLFYYLQSSAYQTEVELGWSFGTQQNIGMRQLETLPVCVPPKEEQIRIVEYLNDKISLLKAIDNKISKTISLIDEYRSSLISAAVTGQLAIEEAEE